MTTDRLSIGQAGITSEIAASLPRYDPLARTRSKRGSALMLLSLVVNLGLLWAIWGWRLGAIIEEDVTVVVRMIEEVKPPEPEPEQARPKVLQRRVLNARPTMQAKQVQNEVKRLNPTPVVPKIPTPVQLAQVQKTEAPKAIKQREFQTTTINEFADKTVRENVEVAAADAAARPQIQVSQSAGPKLTEASSPSLNPDGSVPAPFVPNGRVSSSAGIGGPEGAIADVEAGNASRYTTGDGKLGYQTGIQKDCMKDPVCVAYLKMIQDRVYARWNPETGVRGGEVRLRFQVDKSGGTHGVKLIGSSSANLGQSCETAFRHASPFPPPPESIHYLVREGIVATFTMSGQGSSE